MKDADPRRDTETETETDTATDTGSDAGTDDRELEPAFDIDLDPEDQGTAEAAAESSG